ncbi:hypothetical protein K450DRAFT_229409 [Umbelopsis ramanniana AG]|uniref:Uncharacterized protein n=1 Tax=Umbelopsis ramanniana AG TaxID=1314678 RepID=A0AAD5HGJ8_UMBRA|nr:uncharacterized protein K450DRAFT_229409 [Umbelopsis ramanniana AG]KAI8582179.1 hypothetical protein K450DRAFT_229409 [Umbelopsis ramanniana AG]
MTLLRSPAANTLAFRILTHHTTRTYIYSSISFTTNVFLPPPICLFFYSVDNVWLLWIISL